MRESDILITSIGQSADARMIKVIAQKFNLISDFEQLAKADIVKNYKILVLVVGGSSKGLGAVGIDKEQELIRTKSKEMKIPALMYGRLMKRKY